MGQPLMPGPWRAGRRLVRKRSVCGTAECGSSGASVRLGTIRRGVFAGVGLGARGRPPSPWLGRPRSECQDVSGSAPGRAARPRAGANPRPRHGHGSLPTNSHSGRYPGQGRQITVSFFSFARCTIAWARRTYLLSARSRTRLDLQAPAPRRRHHCWTGPTPHWSVGQCRELVHIRLVVRGRMDVGVLDHPRLPLLAPLDDLSWATRKGGQLRRVLDGQPVVVGGPPCPCPPGPVLAGGPGSAGGPLLGGETVVGGAETLGGEALALPVGDCRCRRSRPRSRRRPCRLRRRQPPAPGTPPSPPGVRGRRPGRPARPGTARPGPPRWRPARPPTPGPGCQPTHRP